MKIEIDTSELNSSFAKVMANIEDGIKNDVMVKIAMDTHRNLQKATPHQTGRAKAGWNTTVDSAPSDWAPPAGKRSYAQTSFSGENSIAFDSEINISNNVEYIIPLEQGHSKQRPHGFINTVLSRLTAQLNSIIRTQNRRVIK